ncbi:MAG: hypothetical protein ACLSA6_13985 [Holdemania massiliensis]
MLDNAMLAHKRAKQSGKGSLVWYDQQLLNRMNQETLLIKQRHAALAQHEFKLYLQPKFEIPSLSLRCRSTGALEPQGRHPTASG